MTDQPILVIAYDRLGPIHAGPAIRTLALAGELADVAPVEVLFEGEPPQVSDDRISFVRRESISPSPHFFSRYRLALAPPLVALTLPEILETDLPLVVDLFDPIVWENLELYRHKPPAERDFQHERHLAALIAALLRGDYFLVAGNRQQDLVLGALMALNRTNPSTWLAEQGPEQLVALVPFGLPAEPPPSADDLPIPDILPSDGPLVVWGGGMWDWLRPEIVVRAWPEVLASYPTARLAFPGTEHPNPHVPDMASVRRVRKLAEDLGIHETVVYGRWLPRDEYLGLLARADLGVSAHAPGLEARYAVRTRILDSVWMGVPMVVSGGDEYSDLIAQRELGLVVEAPDPSAFAKAMVHVLRNGRGAYAAAFSRARAELTWRRLARPLTLWASAPRSTHGPGAEFFRQTLGRLSPRERPSDLRSLLARLVARLRRT